MHREGYRSLRLVTSWYHMRRSLLEFTRAMPDIEIVAHPVGSDGLRRGGWWHSRAAAILLIGEYHKYLATLLRPFAPLAEPRETVAASSDK